MRALCNESHDPRTKPSSTYRRVTCYIRNECIARERCRKWTTRREQAGKNDATDLSSSIYTYELSEAERSLADEKRCLERDVIRERLLDGVGRNERRHGHIYSFIYTYELSEAERSLADDKRCLERDVIRERLLDGGRQEERRHGPIYSFIYTYELSEARRSLADDKTMSRERCHKRTTARRGQAGTNDAMDLSRSIYAYELSSEAGRSLADDKRFLERDVTSERLLDGGRQERTTPRTYLSLSIRTSCLRLDEAWWMTNDVSREMS
jgi:hypothetical protein